MIEGILNPGNIEMSSNFVVETLFLDIVITSHAEFGKISFTNAPVDGGLNL